LILKSITTLLAVAPFLCIGQGINFQERSLSEALDQAKAEGKEVFIDGYATTVGL